MAGKIAKQIYNKVAKQEAKEFAAGMNIMTRAQIKQIESNVPDKILRQRRNQLRKDTRNLANIAPAPVATPAPVAPAATKSTGRTVYEQQSLFDVGHPSGYGPLGDKSRASEFLRRAWEDTPMTEYAGSAARGALGFSLYGGVSNWAGGGDFWEGARGGIFTGAIAGTGTRVAIGGVFGKNAAGKNLSDVGRYFKGRYGEGGNVSKQVEAVGKNLSMQDVIDNIFKHGK